MAANDQRPDIGDASDVITVAEAAKLLRVGRNAVYDAVGRGELPHLRIGKQIRLSRVAIMQSLISRGPSQLRRR